MRADAMAHEMPSWLNLVLCSAFMHAGHLV